MSSLIDWSDDFELNDRVSFVHYGMRLYGEIARVYNTRTCYHVEVEGKRYFVEVATDEMRRE